jgi:hypothetical protein
MPTNTPIRLPDAGTPGPDMILTEVDLLSADREHAVVRVWAATTGEACMTAEDIADERLGGDWAMNDWRGLA